MDKTKSFSFCTYYLQCVMHSEKHISELVVTEYEKRMAQNIYPFYYIRILKELEKKESTKKELREKLGIPTSKVYRAIYRLQIDELIAKEMRDGVEFWKLTDKGREYLKQLKELVNA